MPKYQLRTFVDIIDKVCESLKIQSSDSESRRRIKRNINTIYLDEVIPFKRWQWLRGNRTLQAEAYFSSGTAAVTQNTVAVTLTQAPTSSRKGYFFSVVGEADVYRILSHTAGSTSLLLETPYNGSTLSTASFRIWTDAVPLPSEAKEVVEVTHPWSDRPLENQGLQEYRRTVASQPRAEGRPRFYTTTAFKDPDPYAAISGLPSAVSRSSTGLIKTLNYAANISSYVTVGDQIEVEAAGNYVYNGQWVVSSVSGGSLTYTGTVPSEETAQADTSFTTKIRSSASYESYRELLIYPAMSDKRTTLHVDFQKNAEPLEDDSDEPMMPLEDRIILFYGAMWLSADRERNPEWATQNFQLFERRLARMAGKTEDSPDKPLLKVSSLYMSGKRFGSRKRDTGIGSDFGSSAGGGAGSSITGTANTVAIFDENGDLIGSTEITTTALNFLVGAEGGQTATLAASTTDGVVDSWNATTYKHVQVIYGLTRGTAYESGTIYVSSDGSAAVSATAGTFSTSGSGISFSADVSGGSIRLLYTSDAGVTGALTYRTLLL